MPTSPLNVVIKHLMADCGPDGGGMTDGELLTRFVSGRDDNALAALVRRHAPMVWGVCGRLLHNHHDAEDAFQATFLVLVRKAADVPRQAIPNWLYGVARQTAVRLRATTAKRGRRETQVVHMPEPTVAEVREADWQIVLDEELSRLPDHYRSVVVLCDLEGMTRREAARQLGIPEGSVASRLARARAILARRLTQRGIVFSGVLVAAVLAAGSASASAPPALVSSTIEAASLLAAGRAAGVVSARVAALTEGMVKTMFATRIKSVLAVVLVLAALAGGAGMVYQSQAGEQPLAKEEQTAARKDRKQGEAKQAQQKPPAKTDQEHMVGGWVIVSNDGDRNRKGENWIISKDEIVMNANLGGFRVFWHYHRLDAGKDPKHIDITVKKSNGEFIGLIKGIYAFADDSELRLCLGEMDKDRPSVFAGKQGQSEFLILHDGDPAAWQRKAKAANVQPQNESAQRLFAKWQASARTDGKIPGALIGQLALDLDNFLQRYAQDKSAPALTKLRPRFDASHDWTQADAVALLDDITANSTAPVGWRDLGLTFAEMRNFKSGQPLPKELKTAAWGAPETNGLRAAWLLEPRAKEYALGTVLNARVLFHNTGKEPVVFVTETWHQWDRHKARDAKGVDIKVAHSWRTGLTPKVTYRLAPGEYCEVLGHTIGIGAAGGASIAAKAGDEVTLTHDVDATFGTQASDPEVWKKSIAARVEREGPVPKAAADREQLIRRVTLDVFGVPASAREIAAFVGDKAPDALAKLTVSLQAKPRIEPWAGRLPTGETKFRVTAAEAK